jgi:arylsulfatase A-like enzyme
MMKPKSVCVWLSALLSLGHGLAAENRARPNILFILTDDQRWNALGCMGDLQVQTPNLDRLATQGVLFRNHFVTTSICCVSRASIFTGQYERRHGIGDFTRPLTAAQWAQTYPALLRQHGYYTGFIGKFGVAQEFDYWRGVAGQGGRYFIEPNDPTQTHATARMGGQALEFLHRCPRDQPFCLSISFTAPHARDHMPREYTPDRRDEPLYTNATLPHPPTATESYFQLLPKAVQSSEARTRWHWRFDTPEKFQRNTKDYYRLITGIDREVGRILAELQTSKRASNTVVLFTSDNGYFLGDRGLAGKWFMYEESLRDPLIICDPRQPPGRRGRTEAAMTLNIDFAPTMLDLAGLPAPAGMQGRSLMPLVRDQRPSDWRTDFFYEHHFGPAILPPSEGVRTERWAYIRWINQKPLIEELFDLQSDPLEGHNLAADPAHAATLAHLRDRWKAYRQDLQ